MKKHHEVKHFNIPVDLSMYDKLPYTINPETKRQISVVSGNLLKYYYVAMDEEKKVIDPNDSDPNIIDSTATDIDSSFDTDNSYSEEETLETIDNDISSQDMELRDITQQEDYANDSTQYDE